MCHFLLTVIVSLEKLDDVHFDGHIVSLGLSLDYLLMELCDFHLTG